MQNPEAEFQQWQSGKAFKVRRAIKQNPRLVPALLRRKRRCPHVSWKRHGLETANILWQNAEAAPSRRFSNIAFPTYGKEHFAFLAMLRGEAEN